MVWGKAGSTTLGSANANIELTGLTNSKFSNVMINTLGASTNSNVMLRLGNGSTDTGSNYAWRQSANGGSEEVYTTQSNIMIGGGSGTYPKFVVGYVFNKSGEEKLCIFQSINRRATGAGNAPERTENVGKWVNTSNPLDTITANSSAGTFNSDSNISALGSDLTPAAAITFPTNVQVGSRAEITDTRKMYHYADNSTKGLKAYYKFEDNVTNSQTTGDGLGSSANISLSGNTSYVTGKLSKALSFDGTDDYAIIGSSLSNFNFMHNTTHEFTVAFWFKSSDMSSMGMIFTTAGDTSSSNYGIAIRRNNSSTMAVNFAAGTNQNRLQDTQAGFSTDANWHHIVITAKASDSTNSLQYWQDGVSLGTTSNTGKVFSDTNATYAPMLGGESTSPEQDLNGQIDNLNIWNRRLTDAEIATLYNSGTGIVLTDGMANFKAWSEEGT